jgi:hypothetical protein
MMPPFEDRNIAAIWAPSMNWLVEATNNIGFAHLILHVLPHGLQSDAYWVICKKDSWLLQRLGEEYPDIRVVR